MLDVDGVCVLACYTLAYILYVSCGHIICHFSFHSFVICITIDTWFASFHFASQLMPLHLVGKNNVMNMLV